MLLKEFMDVRHCFAFTEAEVDEESLLKNNNLSHLSQCEHKSRPKFRGRGHLTWSSVQHRRQ
jgi:hypothetical protein